MGAFVQATSEYTAEDVFNLKQMYGRQGYDRKYVYNTFLVYSPPFYKGQSGLMGRVLGGWTFATIFTAGSGTPIEVYTTTGDSEEFGSGDNTNYFSNQNAVTDWDRIRAVTFTAIPIKIQARANCPAISSRMGRLRRTTGATRSWDWTRGTVALVPSTACPTGTWTSA